MWYYVPVGGEWFPNQEITKMHYTNDKKLAEQSREMLAKVTLQQIDALTGQLKNIKQHCETKLSQINKSAYTGADVVRNIIDAEAMNMTVAEVDKILSGIDNSSSVSGKALYILGALNGYQQTIEHLSSNSFYAESITRVDLQVAGMARMAVVIKKSMEWEITPASIF